MPTTQQLVEKDDRLYEVLDHTLCVYCSIQSMGVSQFNRHETHLKILSLPKYQLTALANQITLTY